MKNTRKNYCPIANVQHAKLPKPENKKKNNFTYHQQMYALHNLLILCLICECACAYARTFFMLLFGLFSILQRFSI